MKDRRLTRKETEETRILTDFKTNRIRGKALISLKISSFLSLSLSRKHSLSHTLVSLSSRPHLEDSHSTPTVYIEVPSMKKYYNIILVTIIVQ